MTPRTIAQSVADALRSRIGDGTYPPGTTLPMLATIAETYGCAKNTARSAVRALEAEGLVSTSQGRRATVIAAPRQPVPSTEARLDAIERRLDAAGI